jgi:5'-phosphate synthase pdxT subunit
LDAPMEMVFIRAPIIERVGKGVEVLAEYDDKPALVQQGRVLAATFHPELTSDPTVHRHFLRMLSNGHAKTATKPAAKSPKKKIAAKRSRNR